MSKEYTWEDLSQLSVKDLEDLLQSKQSELYEVISVKKKTVIANILWTQDEIKKQLG